jgi:hypothetical protein
MNLRKKSSLQKQEGDPEQESTLDRTVTIQDGIPETEPATAIEKENMVKGHTQAAPELEVNMNPVQVSNPLNIQMRALGPTPAPPRLIPYIEAGILPLEMDLPTHVQPHEESALKSPGTRYYCH